MNIDHSKLEKAQCLHRSCRQKCIQSINPANFIIVNSGYAEMCLRELFSGRIAETVLLLTATLMEQNIEKKAFVSPECLCRWFSCVKDWIMEASLCSVMN